MTVAGDWRQGSHSGITSKLLTNSLPPPLLRILDATTGRAKAAVYFFNVEKR